MKKILVSAIMFAGIFASALASNVSDEILSFKVMFKWGLINKHAGNVTVTTTLNPSDNTFSSLLVGRSTSWADKIFSVRDTLQGTIMKETLEPIYYEKLSHEGGTFRRDVINYSRSGSGDVAGTGMRYKQKKNKPMEHSEIMLKANGITLDMLSALYYMRNIPYSSMSPGEQITLNVFSGKKKEILLIRYVDDVTIKNDDGEPIETHHISFTFTSDGVNVSSDGLEAWITTDDSHVPVKLSGRLPIGRINVILTGRQVF